MKRKYKRSGKYVKRPQEPLESTIEPLKVESGVIVPKELNDTQIKELKKDIEAEYQGVVNAHKPFTFEDLPLSLRMQVETALRNRKLKKLPDDSIERKATALRNYLGSTPR
jgi:hypothetical protein